MIFKGFSITIRKAGVISDKLVYVFFDARGYTYMSENLLKLIFIVIREWRSDKHLVG